MVFLEYLLVEFAVCPIYLNDLSLTQYAECLC